MINFAELTLQELKDLDWDNMSEEDLLNARKESLKCMSLEQGVKLLIVSIYGAFGNEYFHWYNVAIAESVTGQGRSAIKYAMANIKKYFFEDFHRDRELLLYLKVPPEKLDSIKPLKNDPCIAGHTDSSYISFEEPMLAVNWDGDATSFILAFYQFRLKQFFVDMFEAFARKYNTENFLEFELETISDNGIWLAKGKYIQNIRRKDKKVYPNLTYIKPTGVEIISKSTPIFARNSLMETVKFIFSKGRISIKHYPELISRIKEIKKEFKLAGIEKTALTKKISEYKKYVLNDTDGLEIASKCPIHVRAAAYHNYLVTKHGLKNKYGLISHDEKVKYYYCDDKFCDVFAFKPGNFPLDFAPKMNFEENFDKVILSPINRLLGPAKLNPLHHSLAYTIAAF